MLLHGSASTEQSQVYNQRSIIENQNNATKTTPKLAAKIKSSQSMLPPFKSEEDIAAEKTKKANLTFRLASYDGNTYYRGYCTWYAKSKRPDLPNNLGNARTWYVRAAAQGIPTGSQPKTGAIGQTGNHVVYVEKVNDDGTILISEMNYRGFGVIDTRTVSAGNFNYIY